MTLQQQIAALDPRMAPRTDGETQTLLGGKQIERVEQWVEQLDLPAGVDYPRLLVLHQDQEEHLSPPLLLLQEEHLSPGCFLLQQEAELLCRDKEEEQLSE